MASKVRLAPMNGVAVTVFAVCVAAGASVSMMVRNSLPLIVGGLVGLYMLFAIKVVHQWEKVALLRLGKYVGLRGPAW